MHFPGVSRREKQSTCELLVHVRNPAPNEQTYYLAVSSAARGYDAVLIKIVARSGELAFTNTPGVDVFPTMEDAKRHLEVAGRYSVKKSGYVVLGYAIVACNAWVLLSTGREATANLPGNHTIYTISDASWQPVPLQIRTPYPEQDYKHGEMLNEFPVAGYHYYCESADVTRPFPSDSAVDKPSWEFVWNYYLTQPFRRVGLPEIAPPMLQGMAEEKPVRDMHGKQFRVVFFGRRSRLHAGTRYKARGLNNRAGPANEIECEQLLLRNAEMGRGGGAAGGAPRAAQWSSYVWRRGSVPLRWSQTVKSNGVGTAIAIESDRTFSGSRRYFRRVQMRYHKQALPAEERAEDGLLTPSQRADSLRFPVAVVNLLRKGSIDRDRSEARLYSAFCDLMAALAKGSPASKEYAGSAGLNIVNIGFDWHELAGAHGSLLPVVQMLWGCSGPQFRQSAFSHGTLVDRVPGDALPAGGTAWGRTLCALRESRQLGIFRFNCADSLDRTNVASFYSSLQVLLEQAREMQLKVVRHVSMLPPLPVAPEPGMESPSGARGGTGAQNAKKMFSNVVRGMNTMFGSSSSDLRASGSGGQPALPPPVPEPAPKVRGWEKRTYDDHDGVSRDVWVNHETKETSWTPPVEPEYEAWELVTQQVLDIKRCVDKRLLVAYKDLFLVSGDRNAELYTGSAAMHSAQLDLLLTEGDASAGHGLQAFVNNAHTAVRRRINNIVTDERTHSIFEMVLGLPSKTAAQGVSDACNQGVSFEVAVEAQALPVTDDPDSDDDDPLSRAAWPAINAAHVLSALTLDAGGDAGGAAAGQQPRRQRAFDGGSGAAPGGGGGGGGAAVGVYGGGTLPALPSPSWSGRARSGAPSGASASASPGGNNTPQRTPQRTPSAPAAPFSVLEAEAGQSVEQSRPSDAAFDFDAVLGGSASPAAAARAAGGGTAAGAQPSASTQPAIVDLMAFDSPREGSGAGCGAEALGAQAFGGEGGGVLRAESLGGGDPLGVLSSPGPAQEVSLI